MPAFVGVVTVSYLCGVLAGAAAMLGHWRPLFLRFEKGGKMVATGAGVLFAVAPLVGLVAAVTWFGLFLLTRYASVASVCAALSVPVAALGFGYPVPVIVFAAARRGVGHRPAPRESPAPARGHRASRPAQPNGSGLAPVG